MSDFYVKKFMPNVKHIIAYVLILLSAVLFINGIYRAFRVSGRLNPSSVTFDVELGKNESVLLSSKPFKARLKETEREHDVVWKTMSKGLMSTYGCFIVHVAEKYRPVMVKIGTEEYNKFLDGEEVTGYFTEKNFDDFPQFVSDISRYYEIDRTITDKDYSTLGIVIVNRQQEFLSFLWGVPFLVTGLIILKIAGSVFFYAPESITEMRNNYIKGI